MIEDEMVGWHHQLNGHEFEQAPEEGEGQGSLACCSPWGHKESDAIERQQHSRFTILCKFQVYSKVIQLYIYIHICIFIFLVRIFSFMDHCKSIVRCAIH